MKKTLLWVVGIILLIGVLLVGPYNNLVTKSTAIAGQWGQVENQFQRRFDLVPNLVSAVQGVMNQEKEVFGKIAEARTRYSGAVSQDQKVEAAGQFEGALSRLLVVMENYPVLRSNENVTSLMDELAGTENRIAVERKRYNEVVGDYNLLVTRFPGMIYARLFGYSSKPFFSADAGAQTAPKVDLNSK